MATSSPLDTLITLARDSRDNAGVELSGLRRAQQEAKAQLDTLLQYRHEYRQKLQNTMESGIGPASWSNYQQFLRSLDDAIARSRQALSEREAQLTQGQLRWQTEQRRLSAYDTLVDRRDTAERQRVGRREQRMADEMSAGMRFRRQAQQEHSGSSH
ncbi:flagellar export protein FliJ [Halomonas sp. PR-M31]|uniref:flagellar export protein FliJ n=1 Tax=Halomonas sp. PR-M31 TaxID=1471202 RepID=UPI000652054F|nr:flagellar export protein FliJ [Halomonas sp. PR-M31]